MDILYQTLLDAMIEKASKIGANGIIGFSIDIDEISGEDTSMLMIQGLGTAVMIEPIVVEMKPDPAIQQISTVWQCAKCNRLHSQRIMYCTFCGEARHYDWICSSCKTINGTNDNFYASCGKARDVSEEIYLLSMQSPMGLLLKKSPLI